MAISWFAETYQRVNGEYRHIARKEERNDEREDKRITFIAERTIGSLLDQSAPQAAKQSNAYLAEKQTKLAIIHLTLNDRINNLFHDFERFANSNNLNANRLQQALVCVTLADGFNLNHLQDHFPDLKLHTNQWLSLFPQLAKSNASVIERIPPIKPRLVGVLAYRHLITEQEPTAQGQQALQRQLIDIAISENPLGVTKLLSYLADYQYEPEPKTNQPNQPASVQLEVDLLSIVLTQLNDHKIPDATRRILLNALEQLVLTGELAANKAINTDSAETTLLQWILDRIPQLPAAELVNAHQQHQTFTAQNPGIRPAIALMLYLKYALAHSQQDLPFDPIAQMLQRLQHWLALSPPRFKLPLPEGYDALWAEFWQQYLPLLDQDHDQRMQHYWTISQQLWPHCRPMDIEIPLQWLQSRPQPSAEDPIANAFAALWALQQFHRTASLAESEARYHACHAANQALSEPWRSRMQWAATRYFYRNLCNEPLTTTSARLALRQQAQNEASPCAEDAEVQALLAWIHMNEAWVCSTTPELRTQTEAAALKVQAIAERELFRDHADIQNSLAWAWKDVAYARSQLPEQRTQTEAAALKVQAIAEREPFQDHANIQFCLADAWRQVAYARSQLPEQRAQTGKAALKVQAIAERELFRDHAEIQSCLASAWRYVAFARSQLPEQRAQTEAAALKVQAIAERELFRDHAEIQLCLAWAWKDVADARSELPEQRAQTEAAALKVQAIAERELFRDHADIQNALAWAWRQVAYARSQLPEQRAQTGKAALKVQAIAERELFRDHAEIQHCLADAWRQVADARSQLPEQRTQTEAAALKVQAIAERELFRDHADIQNCLADAWQRVSYARSLLPEQRAQTEAAALKVQAIAERELFRDHAEIQNALAWAWMLVAFAHLKMQRPSAEIEEAVKQVRAVAQRFNHPDDATHQDIQRALSAAENDLRQASPGKQHLPLPPQK